MIRLDRPICPDPAKLATNYKHPVNKEALIKACFGKCMYCESNVRHVYPGDVEHIKPVSQFPDLEFSWGNLGYSCSRCNHKKSDKYYENTPFLNPFQDDPSDYLVATGHWLVQKQGNERAELTILELDLNREDLLIKRQEALQALTKSIDACFRASEPLRSILLKVLQKNTDPSVEYSFVLKAYLLQQEIAS